MKGVSSVDHVCTWTNASWSRFRFFHDECWDSSRTSQGTCRQATLAREACSKRDRRKSLVIQKIGCHFTFTVREEVWYDCDCELELLPNLTFGNFGYLDIALKLSKEFKASQPVF